LVDGQSCQQRLVGYAIHNCTCVRTTKFLKNFRARSDDGTRRLKMHIPAFIGKTIRSSIYSVGDLTIDNTDTAQR